MQHASRPEHASTTVEAVSLAVALVALTGALAIGLSGSGGDIASAMAGRLRDAVTGDGASERSAPPRYARPDDTKAGGAWRDQRERRWSAGDDPPRVSRNDLRLNPMLPDLAAWRDSSERTFGDAAGATLRGGGSIEACLLCIDSGWRNRVSAGISKRPASAASPPGLGGEVEAQASVALAAAEVLGNVEHLTGWGGWNASGRLRGTIGAEADGRLSGTISRSTLVAEARGGAMAGAVARAEARAGVDLLGVAISGTGRAEGWAGIGARGSVGVRREGGVVGWTIGGGAAVGVGGAAEWSGRVDVSKVSTRHRDAAATTIASAATRLLPGLPGAVLAIRSTNRGTR